MVNLDKSREVISVHIGQAGVQLGNACWELYCLEHGLTPSGEPTEGFSMDADHCATISTFFSEPEEKKYVPRSCFIDLEASVIDEVRNGAYRSLYNPDFMITGIEDAANNYARGMYTVGKEKRDEATEQIRKLAEDCNGLQGILVFLSIGGGTGSGLGASIIQNIREMYSKKSKLGFTIFPSPKVSTSVVEPYNSILATHALLEHLDIGIMLDNEAIYEICKSKLKVTRPGYGNLNRLIAQVVSSVTSSIRFKGKLNIDLNEFQTNLVPYPRIHFCVPAYAPIIAAERANHEGKNLMQITNQCFDGTNNFAMCNVRDGYYVSVAFLYRGEDIGPKEVNDAIFNAKSKPHVKYLDWIPTGNKMGINDQVPSSVPGSEVARTNRSIATLSNNTAIAEVFERVSTKFDLLYSKRAFVHWFCGEGMEESEFGEARQDLQALAVDYECTIDQIEEESQQEELG